MRTARPGTSPPAAVRGSRKSRIFYLLTSAACLLLAELILITIVRGGFPRPLGTVGGWVSLVMTVCLMTAIGWRELRNRREEARLLQQHEQTMVALAALSEPLLQPIGVEGLLQEMVHRMRVLLDVDVAAVYLTSEGGGVLSLRAMDGVGPKPNSGTPFVDDRIVNRIAADRQPSIWAGHGERVGQEAANAWVSAAGCPMVVADRVIGVCIIGCARPRVFNDRDVRLFQIVANHVAVRIERARLDEAERASRAAAAHAGRQVSLLARAGGLLATAIEDYQPSLEALVDCVVPEFADWCVVHFAERTAAPVRLACRHAATHTDCDGDDLNDCHPDWKRLWTQAMDSGQPQISPAGDEAAGPDAGGASEVAAQAPSCMVAPVQVGGMAWGAVTFANDSGRREFQLSDLAVAAEVAGRISVAAERVLLYREVSEAARASAETANQLRQLVDGSLSLQRLRSGADILTVAATSCRSVLRAEMTVVSGLIGKNEWLRAVARPGTAVECHPIDHPAVQDVATSDMADDPEEIVVRDEWLSIPLTRPDGTVRGTIWATRLAGFGPDGQAMAVLIGQMTSAALDAMDQYHTAQRRQDRWRSLIEAAPAAIAEITLDGRVVLWNRTASGMFPWADHDDADETVDAFPAFTPDTAVALSGLRDRTLAGEETVEAELSVEVAAGEMRDLRISMAPLSTDGTLYGMLMLATDMTEHNRLQEGALRAEQMEALGQVAGGVAHDFNNLLTVITGYTDLLREKVVPTSGDRELLDGIRAAADRASVLTRQLLTISHRQVTNPVVLAPHSMRQSLGEVLERILGIDVSLDWDLDPEAGHVRIDPGRFEQVILNLAINARDAMPQGGRLTISTDSASPADGPVRLQHPSQRCVRVTVTDTGDGMDEATRLRCFEPFFTTKDRSKGTGLGLATVQSIVAECEGHVHVRSEPGVGTSFELYFPSVDEEVMPELPQPPAKRSWGSDIVLVVEDQPEVLKLIRRVLEREGYLVLEAENGPEAIRIVKQWEGSIELLITDVVMPGMKGPEVAAAIKALRPRIKVMFTSAYSHGTVLPDALGGDPAVMLPKPFKPSELISHVRSVLDQRRQRQVGGDNPHPGPS